MSEQQRPESWIGGEVLVARSSSTEAELVSLESITKWGIVCTYQQAEIGVPVLIPWASVSWVRLAVQEEMNPVEEDS